MICFLCDLDIIVIQPIKFIYREREICCDCANKLLWDDHLFEIEHDRFGNSLIKFQEKIIVEEAFINWVF